MLQCPVSRAFLFYNNRNKRFRSMQNVAMPSFSGFSFLLRTNELLYQMLRKLQCPVSRAFLFYYQSMHFVLIIPSVAMPSFSGFSFLQYTSRTSVKSITFSIVFAINSQNILKSFIFLSVFGFPIFLLT